MIDENYKVYVRADTNNTVVEINSSAFLQDTEGWTEIDEGNGYEYRHAQRNYLPTSLFDEDGIGNYKLVDGEIQTRTDEDKMDEREKVNAQREIITLKSKLADTDYIAAKLAEGVATREEYADKLAERARWRNRINELENLV